MIPFLQWLADAAWVHGWCRAMRLMERLYPDVEERAMMLIAEGTRQLETVYFGNGATIARVMVEPETDGSVTITTDPEGVEL